MPAVARVALLPEPHPSTTAFATEVLAGLTAEPKTLPAKLFYDSTGSRLFERITHLPEYYPTRTELEILKSHAADIARLLPQQSALIEFGSGSGKKASILLRAAPHVAKLPRGGFFPGSTIGNFEPHEACTFLRNAGRIHAPGVAQEGAGLVR